LKLGRLDLTSRQLNPRWWGFYWHDAPACRRDDSMSGGR
jgi:hypothetical protein